MSEIDLTEKGKSIKDLPEILLIENNKEIDFTFQPIYELGRHVSEGDKEFSMLDLNLINCNPLLKENVIQFFHILAEKILSDNLNFPSILIDFVVFDPEDRKGERFHIAICSTSAELIENYIGQVQLNIDGNKKDFEGQPQARGPILTNNKIYKSPYFYRGPKERTFTNPTFFHDIKRYSEVINPDDEGKQKTEFHDRMRVFFGSFKAKRENKLDKEIQKAHIEIFFDQIEKELHLGKGVIKINGKEIPEKKFEFNTSLLIPLLRPAASFMGDKDFRLRGGGLFVYGNTHHETNLTELVSRLQHFFYRSILNESHTQIVYDYLRHENTNHQIHDFKAFLNPEIINKIKRVVDRNPLPELDRKELMEVVHNAEMFREYLNEILEAYRDFIHQNAKTVRYSASDLQGLLNELNTEFTNELYVRFIDEINNSAIGIKVTHIILKKIFRNLYSNTIAEYNKLQIPLSEREANVRWFISEAADVVTVEYYNKGLRINNELIKDFGITPIVGHSTGLGGYFINNTLGWMHAEENKLPGEIQTKIERFIKAENENGGVKFSFKFKHFIR